MATGLVNSSAAVAREERTLFNNFVNKVQALPEHEERRYSKYSTATLRWAWSVVLSRGVKLPAGKFNDDVELSGRPCLIPGSGEYRRRYPGTRAQFGDR